MNRTMTCPRWANRERVDERCNREREMRMQRLRMRRGFEQGPAAGWAHLLRRGMRRPSQERRRVPARGLRLSRVSSIQSATGLRSHAARSRTTAYACWTRSWRPAYSCSARIGTASQETFKRYMTAHQQSFHQDSDACLDGPIATHHRRQRPAPGWRGQHNPNQMPGLYWPSAGA